MVYLPNIGGGPHSVIEVKNVEKVSMSFLTLSWSIFFH